MEEGNLWFTIGADNTNFSEAANDTNKKLKQMSENVKDFQTSISSSFKDAAMGVAAFAGVTSLTSFANSIISTRKEIESLEVSFQTLLGSKDKADELFSAIKDYAVSTPMLLNDLSSGAQTMLGFGIDESKIMDYLKELGDVSMGDTNKFNSLVLAFSQIQAAGKLAGQDLLQLINAGFNPLNEISKKTGKSIGELKDDMSKGAISADMVADAFKSATSEGGQFNGMLEAQSHTLNGAISNLQGAFDDMLNDLGEQAEGILTSSISAATDIVKNYESIGKVILAVAEAYGALKAAEIAYLAVNKIKSLSTSLQIIMAYRKEMGLATAAQQMFNVSVNANAYVAIGAALLTVITYLATFVDWTDKASESQKAINDATANTNAKIASETSEMGSLVRAIKTTNQGTTERKQLIDEFNSKYGTYLSKLLSEKSTVEDITKAYNECSKAIRNKAAEEMRSEQTSRINKEALEEQQEIVKKMTDDLMNSGFNNTEVQTIVSRFLDESNKNLKNASFNSAATLIKIARDFSGTGKSISSEVQGFARNYTNSLRTAYNETLTVNRQIDAITGKATKTKGTSSSDTDTKKNKSGKTKKDYEDELKTKQSELDALEKTNANESKRAKLLKEIDAIQKNIDWYSSSKQNQAAKQANTQAAKEEKQETRELEKRENTYNELLQMQQKTDQDRISLMKDSHEKRMDEIQNAYDEEINEIKKQASKWVKANSESGLDKSEISSSISIDSALGTDKYEGLTEAQKKVLESAIENANKTLRIKSREVIDDEKKSETEAQIELLTKWGDYEEKKLAIKLKYEQKAKEINESSDTPDVKNIKLEINAKEQADEYKSLEEQYKGSVQAFADLFGDASKKSVSEIQKIIDKYEELVKYLEGDTSIDLKALGFTDDDIKKIKEGKISLKDVTDAVKNVKGSLNEKSSWQSFKKDFIDGLTNLKNSKSVSEVGKGITQIGNSITSFTPALKQFSSDIGNIFGFDDAKLEDVIDGIDSIGQTASGVGQIMSGDIVGGAMSAISGISGIKSALDGLFGADYSQYEKMQEEYNSLISVWDDIIAKKQEYVSIDYGDEASKTAEEIESIYNKEADAARTLGKERLNSGAGIFSSSVGVKQWDRMNSEARNELKSVLGSNYESILGGRMTGLFDMSAEQLEKLKEEAPTFWAKLDGDVQTYLEKIISCGDAIEDNKEALQESLTGVSFDSFYDDFVSTLTDMDSDSSDFADNFEEYMKNAILQSLMANKYKAKIQELYNKWVNYSDSDGDGKYDLTEEEAAELKKSEKELSDEMIAERDQLKEVFGWTDSYSQDASSKGFETMSQETGEELNGRFTALQIAGENVSAQMNVAVAQLAVMSGSIVQGSSYLNDILAQTVVANSYLEDVVKYSKAMYNDWSSRLQNIENYLK